MKKIISLILSFILIFGLIACNSINPESVTTNSQPDSDAVNTTSSDSADNTAQQENKKEEPVTSEPDSTEEPVTEEEVPSLNTVPVKVAALIGPTGIGLTYLTSYSDHYTLDLFTAPDQVVAKVINGEVDIAAVPVNLASVLYNKTKGAVSVIAVNTLGVLYIVENGETIQSIQDLKGKTIVATGQASTPQYILEYVLSQNGLTDSVTVEYVSDGSELAAKLIKGEVSIGLLPEPQVSVASIQSEGKVRIALSMNDLWDENNDTSIVQGVYIVRNEFLENNPDAVDQFINDACNSAFEVNTSESAPADVVSAGILPKEPIAKKAIPNCNICFYSGEDMKNLVSAMLETLYNANPSSVGGNLPDENFYYVQNS